MSIRYKIAIVFSSLFIVIAVFAFVSVREIYNIAIPIRDELPLSVDNLTNASRLNNLASFIRYYDEVLTQSARNYVFTGDKKWQARYNEEAPKLDKIIKEAISAGDDTDKKTFSDVDAANLALVAMEEKAMTLMDSGKKSEAMLILESNEYAKQKELYKTGLVLYAEKRGQKYDEALQLSTNKLTEIINKSVSALKIGITQVYVLFIILFILMISSALFISSNYIRPIIRMKNTMTKISFGDYSQRVIINSKDEIGELANSFNQMVAKLLESYELVEKKVEERTSQLEKLNKAMVGREIKMIELKKMLAATSKEGGKREN